MKRHQDATDDKEYATVTATRPEVTLGSRFVAVSIHQPGTTAMLFLDANGARAMAAQLTSSADEIEAEIPEPFKCGNGVCGRCGMAALPGRYCTRESGHKSHCGFDD